MKFYIGLHQPFDAQHFDAVCISVNRLRRRKGPFQVGEWMMDSGSFTEVSTHGDYRSTVEEYADQIKRWRHNGFLVAAVSQDYMCEPWILERTQLTVDDHQRLTISRYDDLLRCQTGCYIMPVLQGYEPADYVRHVRQYGSRLDQGMWVGVGSVCKRNGDPSAIETVLLAIHHERPDLRLHGFGLKSTALNSGLTRELLASADSMAWSYHARMNRRNGNDWREAQSWLARIEERPTQRPLFIPA